jgi:hypothetical protein
MRKRAFVPLAAVVVCAVAAACTSPRRGPAWRPIAGAAVTPWEQTQAICAPVLQTVPEARAMAQYRSCMAKHGWTDRAVTREDEDRDAALKQEAGQLEAEIRKRRTKNSLTLFAGVAPRCQSGDPGTEICTWQWTWKSKTQPVTAPIHLTCVLPKNGSPRDDDSCRVDRGH